MRSATAPVLYVKGDLMEQSKAGTKAGRRSRSSVRRKKRADYYDYSLVAVIILLICFGLIMLYSTSSYIAQMNYNDDMFYFKKQALISVGCIVMAIGISMLDYHLLIKLTMPLYGAAIVLMGPDWLSSAVPAGRSSQDRSDRVPVLYDRTDGQNC